MQRGRGKTASTTRKASSKPAPAAAPVNSVAQYAEKDPTPLHKTFARWIVKEVGYDPDDAPSKRQAFLRGVSIATVARNAFTGSKYLADWREETGEAKRGPKPAAEKAAASTTSKGRRKPAPEPEPEEVEEEAEWTEEDLDERAEELQGMTVAKLKAFAKNECEATVAELKGLTKKADVIDFILDYEFPEDDEEESEEDDEDEDEEDEEDDSDEDDDDFEDDDESEEDEDDFEDDDEEETPAPKSRARRGSTAKPSARTTPARRGKSAGGSAKSGKAKDDYLF
jgi:hypothetical protein